MENHFQGFAMAGIRLAGTLRDGIMTSPLDQKIRITGPVVVTANRLGDGSIAAPTADGAPISPKPP